MKNLVLLKTVCFKARFQFLPKCFLSNCLLVKSRMLVKFTTVAQTHRWHHMFYKNWVPVIFLQVLSSCKTCGAIYGLGNSAVDTLLYGIKNSQFCFLAIHATSRKCQLMPKMATNSNFFQI